MPETPPDPQAEIAKLQAENARLRGFAGFVFNWWADQVLIELHPLRKADQTAPIEELVAEVTYLKRRAARALSSPS